MGVLSFRDARAQGPTWMQRLFYLCLLFFVISFGIGLTFRDNDDNMRRRDLTYVIQPSTLNVQQGLDGSVEKEKVNQGHESLSEIDPVDLIPPKQLIIVTPTYNRPFQAFYLNRLGQTLRLVRPPLLWIVVEMNSASMETAEILGNAGVMYRHLVCSKNMTNMTNINDRVVHQRNSAIEHIELHRLDGIVYVADDNNVYSIELFESMRQIRHFGTWPVAMLAQSENKVILEGPVCNGSQVIGWHTNETGKRLRRFHVHMSGFAFNSTILWDPKRLHRKPIRQLDKVKDGFQETTFIEQLVEDESQMEAVSLGCSRVMNWHLHLASCSHVYPKGWVLQKNLDVDVPI